MGIITGYSRRTANIGSGGGGSVATTLYNSDDTILDQVRLVSLYGNTSSDKLIFQTLSGDDVLTFYGDKTINFGSTASSISVNMYSGNGDKIKIYSGSDLRSILDHNYIYFTNVAGTGYSYYAKDGAQIYGLGGRLGFYNTSSQTIMSLQNGGSAVELNYCYPANVTQVYWYGDSISFKPYVKFGAIGTATAGIQVVGTGTTSATTTALFQNSSSVASLKVRDDNYIIQRAINAALADGELLTNQMSFYIDETGNFLICKVKYSGGSVKTCSIPLI